MSDRGYILYQASPIIGRTKLGHLLNRMGLTGEGVEVGVHRGEFAYQILTSWRGDKLFGVDPYTAAYDPEDPAGMGDREDDEQEARKLYEQFGERFTLVKDTSKDALRWFNATLDFVYIDGNHRYAHVAQDLWSWWEKLRSGGLLAGHDIMAGTRSQPNDGGWGHEVQKAVLEFAQLKGVDIWLIPEYENEPWSYYMVKP